MKKLILVTSCSFIFGCAALPYLITCSQVAQVVLPIIDSFYNDVVIAKQDPPALRAATIILQQTDNLIIEVNNQNIDSKEAIVQAQLLKKQAESL